MKRNILILFAVVSLIINLTGCGSSGSSNSVAPATTTMTSLRLSLTQNGQAVTGAEATLYTHEAAMREGLAQAQSENTTASRASIGNRNTEGVYSPTSKSADGIYTFSVPTGEYTLVASKGNSKAVVTTIRAAAILSEEETIAPLNYELTPTGTINGKVVSSVTGVSTAGVIVYLDGTSFVAITKDDGTFSMTGVPEDTFYIAAMTNQNGKAYAAPLNQVVMGSNLIKNDVEVSLSEATSQKIYNISGSITGNDNANKIVMASNGSNFFVGISDENGNFIIKVNTLGVYSVTCFGATEQTQNIDVKSENTTLSPFTINGSSEAYGIVKGNIKFSSSYWRSFQNTRAMPNVDKYLVRLIGTGTTYYSTVTKADYKYFDNLKETLTENDTIATFTFDSVPAGDYSILVDPAGNGFFGACGNISVSANTSTSANVEVEFVKPEFKLKYETNTVSGQDPTINLLMIEEYPFISRNEDNYQGGTPLDTVGYIRMVSNPSSQKLTLSGPESDNKSFILWNVIFADTQESWVCPLSANGKYEITIQRKWSDSNTGLSGTVSESQVIEYKEASKFIGDVEVVYLSDDYVSGSTATFTINITSDYLKVKKIINSKPEDYVDLINPAPAVFGTGYTAKLFNFHHLNNGNYYLESNATGYERMLFDSDGNLIEQSRASLSSRINCVMDKHGFMYRFDSTVYPYRIIKVTSLDGEPVDYYQTNEEDATYNPDGQSVGMDLVENSDGTSTLYWWLFNIAN